MNNRERIPLVVALILLGVATYYRFHDRVPTVRGQLKVARLAAPRLSAVSEDRNTGVLRFTTEGAEVHGIVAAALYPADDGYPRHLEGQNVVAVQKDGTLPLHGWLKERNPQAQGDRWLLHFALLCVEPDHTRPVWWTGWAPVSLSQLRVGGLVVTPEAGARVEISVVTRNGKGVPGVSVAIDPAHRQTGFSMQYVSTGASGTVAVRGLDATHAWSFALPSGAGPAVRAVHAVWRSGDAALVELAIDLAGSWSYTPICIVPPFRGATVTVERMKGAWPCARWLPAGRLPTVCYAMWRTGHEPNSIRVKFAGFPEHEFGPKNTPVLRLHATPQDDS